jgi:hypothetical protein
MSFRGLHNRLDRLERQRPGELSQDRMDPIPLDQPWHMHRLLVQIDAGEVDPATLEPPLAAELAEYVDGLLEACRDTVGERIEAMLREGDPEQGLPCGLVELPRPEARVDE